MDLSELFHSWNMLVCCNKAHAALTVQCDVRLIVSSWIFDPCLLHFVAWEHVDPAVPFRCVPNVTWNSLVVFLIADNAVTVQCRHIFGRSHIELLLNRCTWEQVSDPVVD